MRTIRGRFMLAFFGLVLFIFLIFWIGMEFFIETYYYRQKVATMQKMIQQINTVVELSESPIEKLSDLEYLGYNFEGKITLYNSEKGIVISDDDILSYSKGIIVDHLNFAGTRAYILETDYPVKETKWLVYGENISSGELALLQIPVAAIDQTIEAMNAFIIAVASVVIFVTLVVAIIISTNMTRPIKQLTRMAESLRQLKFDKTYIGNRKDELGVLGETFNDLSIQLDSTIRALQYEISKEKELDVLRKQFVAQVSHELQTPLSIIHGYIEALQDGVVDSNEEREEYYNIIGDESKKMSLMIKELLQLSELESEAFHANKVPLELCNFFDQMVKNYETLLAHSTVSLKYESINKEIWYMADQIKLEQAFRNILNNAIKYAVEGSYINLRMRFEEELLTVSIKNQGPHIREDELAKVFESFYKGSNSDRKEGTGIGLAVSAKVFKLHNITYFAKNHEKGVELVVKLKIDQDQLT